MKSIFTFFLLFCFGYGVFAQVNISESHYLPIGIGFSLYQSKDSYNSPNRYRGLTSKFLIGYENYNLESIHKENFFVQTGSLGNGTPNDDKKSLSRFVYHGELVARNQPVNVVPAELEDQVNYFVGISLKVNFASRSRSRFFQFESFATLNLAASVTYNYNDFQIKGEKWFYDGSINLPVIGIGMRPRYAAHVYEGDVSKFKKNTIGFIYFPKHFDLDASVNANWNMGNGNLLRGTYNWWFYDSRLIHRTRMLENGLNFSLLTKLN